MRGNEASRTAEYMALFRALESARPAGDRLFTDRFARGFLRPSLRVVVALSRVPIAGAAVPWFIDRRWPGARSSGVARTRLIDDELRSALSAGVGQVVLLGAGFDCRAYRVPGIERTRVFEVDHPATAAAKRLRLQRLLGTLPAHVVFVPIDFNRQTLAQAMAAARFDTGTRSVFIWEGVTNYLTAQAVDAVLHDVSAHSASESRLIFTYVHRGVLDGSVPFIGAQQLLATVARAGEPWTWGIDPADLPAYLHVRGLALISDVGAAEYRARYMGAATVHARGYEFYRVAVAEVRGSGTRS